MTAPRSTSTGRAVALAVAAVAAAGWLLYAQWWGQGGRHDVAWRDLNGQLGRVEFTRKVTAVYHSREAFQHLLDRTMPGRAARVPSLDFDRNEVVILSLGPRSSTGYSLRVQRVVERRRGIDVFVREVTPSLGEPVGARVTYPYRAIAIPRTGKAVYVKLQGRP